jgi:hypothetical protein
VQDLFSVFDIAGGVWLGNRPKRGQQKELYGRNCCKDPNDRSTLCIAAPTPAKTHERTPTRQIAAKRRTPNAHKITVQSAYSRRKNTLA